MVLGVTLEGLRGALAAHAQAVGACQPLGSHLANVHWGLVAQGSVLGGLAASQLSVPAFPRPLPRPPRSCRAAGQGQLRERGAPQLLCKQDLLASPGVFHGPGLGRDAVQGPKPSELGRAWGVGLGPASG